MIRPVHNRLVRTVAVIAAKAAGFEVTDLTDVPGSVPARELMTSGEPT